MSVFEQELRRRLRRLGPVVDGAEPDWNDVLVRARRAPSRPRADGLGGRRWRLVVVAAVVAAAAAVFSTPFGRALVSDAWNGFSSWLDGEPGEPAAASVQATFAEINEHAPFGFPPGTSLRLLLTTEAAGYRFQLFGFRTGEQLCLRLMRAGSQGPNPTSCVSISQLDRGKPVQVLVSDHMYGVQDVQPNVDGYRPARAAATFGFATDAVRAVTVLGDDGSTRATLANNAFLAVVENPSLGNRARTVIAVVADGNTVQVPVAPALGPQEPPYSTEQAPGPRTVERTVKAGTIGWLERHEPRGEPVPEGALGTVIRSGEIVWARAVHPDPTSTQRVGVVLVRLGNRPSGRSRGERICYAVFAPLGGAGVGCAARTGIFARGPVSYSLSQRDGGDQYTNLLGLVSDDVARLEAYLAGGDIQPVPIVANAFASEVSRQAFPIRLVAYDRDGRVIFTEPILGFDRSSNPNRPLTDQRRPLLEVTGPNGVVAGLDTAPSNLGGTCFWCASARGEAAAAAACRPAGLPDLCSPASWARARTGATSSST